MSLCFDDPATLRHIKQPGEGGRHQEFAQGTVAPDMVVEELAIAQITILHSAHVHTTKRAVGLVGGDNLQKMFKTPGVWRGGE